MLTISMADANDFVETVILDTTAYRFHFAWNDYAQMWTVDVCNNDNVDIVRGIPLVSNFPLLAQYRRHANIPPGELLAVVTDVNNTAPIGRSDFLNGRASMVYVPEDELHVIMGQAVSRQVS